MIDLPPSTFFIHKIPRGHCVHCRIIRVTLFFSFMPEKKPMHAVLNHMKHIDPGSYVLGKFDFDHQTMENVQSELRGLVIC